MGESELITDVNNNEQKTLVDTFDSEPGYYYQVIRSMLMPGHETELIYWLKNVGLIANSQICRNEDCKIIMEWIPAKTTDYFQWRCRNCSEKKSIRENSVFQNIKCNFKHSIRILLGWCKAYDIDTMTNFLGIKRHTVKGLYDAATAIARKHLSSSFPKIGGPGVIVIIDTYPEGCANNSRPRRGNRPILCIAEAKNIPPRHYFHALRNDEEIEAIRSENLRTIQEIVLPGSILVTRLSSMLCSYYDLQNLKHLYPTIVSVEGLSRHDNGNRTIFANLETIWKLALDVCEEAQFFNYDQVPNFLISRMWEATFGNEAFETLLNQLTDWQ